MATLEASAVGLEVVGQLSILADNLPLQVEFKGSVVQIVLADLRTAFELRKSLGRGERRARFLGLQSLLARSGLELQVWVRSRQVGRLSGKCRPGFAAFLLGMDPFELRLRSILETLLDRNT